MNHPEIIKIEDGKGGYIVINKNDMKENQKEWKEPKQNEIKKEIPEEKRQQSKKDENK